MLPALLFTASCSWFLGEGPHVPNDYQGSAQVTVVNAYDHPMCIFALWTKDLGDDNWLGTPARRKPIPPGGTHVYSVKPGAYHVGGGFCDSDQTIASAGTWNEQTAKIDGATMIVLGPRSVPPHFHEKRIVYSEIRLLGAPQSPGEGEPEQCSPPGAKVASSQDCCDTAKYHQLDTSPGNPYYCD
ncbi:MAG TPA: hypothetical protein VGC41_06005 [Kofleriaceae bacterium]